MKKVAFVSRDPGSTNVMVSIIPRMKEEFSVSVYGKDNAIKIYQSHNIEVNDISKVISSVDVEELAGFLRSIDVDYLFTGQSSPDDMTENYLWEAARQDGIISFTVVDSWCDYDLRFPLKKEMNNRMNRYIPDYIFVMDEESRSDIAKLDIPLDRLIVSGQPYLQYVYDMYSSMDISVTDEYKQSLGIKDDVKVILYVSDAIREVRDWHSADWGYDQWSIFDNLINAIDSINNINESYVLLVRPHPKEDVEAWRRYVSREQHSIPIVVERESRSETAIKAADYVIGIWSIILLEAVLAQKSVTSVQIGRRDKAPFILEDKGLIKPILDKDELVWQMKSYFNGVPVKKIKWDLGTNAIENIAGFVNKIASGVVQDEEK